MPKLHLLSTSVTNPAEPFVLLAESIPQLVWTARPDGRLDYANRRWLEYTGIPPEQIQGWSWKQVVHPDDLAVSLDRWTSAIDSGQSYENEYRLRKSDGTYRWFLVRAEAIFDREQRPVCWFGTCTDIDEQKRQRQISEEKCRKIVAAAHDGICEISADGVFQFVNESLAKMLGYEVDELLGRQVHEFVFEHDREAIRTCIIACLSGNSKSVDLRWRRRDGQELWTLAACSPISDLEGVIVGAVGVLADLTERKAAELQLRASETRFRTSVENLLDCFGIFTAIRGEQGEIVDFRIDYINRAGCENNRRTLDEQLGKGLLEILSGHRESGLFDAYCHVVETGESLSKEMQFYQDDYNGECLSLWFDIRVSKLGDGFVAAWRDVTQRKHHLLAAQDAEQRLRLAIQHSPVVLYQCDRDLRCTWIFNPRHVLFEEASVGARIDEILAPEDVCELVEFKQRVLEEGNAGHVLLSVKRNGQPQMYHVSAEPLRESSGEIVGLTVAAMDLSSLQERAALSVLSLNLKGQDDSCAGISDLASCEEFKGFVTEELLRRVIESTPDLIYAKDAQGRLILANSATLDAIGKSAKEVIGRTDDAWHFNKEEAARIIEHDTRIMRCGKAEVVEEHFTRQRGQTRVFRSTKNPLLNAGGEVIGLVGVSRDVTESKHAETQLRQNERHFRELADSAPAMLWLTDQNHNCTYISNAWLRFTGQTKEQTLGMGWLDAVHPDDQEMARKVFTEAAARRDTFALQYRIRGSGGRYFWAIDSGCARTDADGNFIGYVGSVVEVEEWKRAEELVRQGAIHLRQVLDSLFTFVAELTPDGTLTMVNQAPLLAAEIEAEDVIGRQFWDCYWWNYDAEIQAQLRKAISRPKAGETVRYDVAIRVAHESLMWIDFQIAPLCDQDGNVTHLIPSAMDITQRRESEERIRDNEERFRTMADGVPLPIWVHGADGEQQFVNNAFCEFFGVSRKEMSGGQWRAVIHPDDDDQYSHKFLRSVEKRQPFNSMVRVRRADGSWRWIESWAQPRFSPNGEFLGMVGASADVTDREHAQAELLESEERFRTLADNIMQLAWMKQPDGKTFWYNKRWFEYTGTTLEQMRDWGWMKVHHPEHVDRVVASLKESLAKGNEWEEIFPLRGKDGEYRWFLTRAVPIRDREGNIVHWFGTNTDINEHRKMQDELQQAAAQLSEADRRKNEFLAMLAHELRNPLAPVRTGIELLKLSGDNPETRVEILATMERQTEQLVRLVDDLMDVSRVTRGKLRLHKNRVSIAEVLRNAVEAIQPMIDEAGHELEVSVPEQAVFVDGDAHRLAQAVSNLLSNAVRYTPMPGKIWLKVEFSDDQVLISVRDTGIGVAAELIDHIFDMFTQLEHLDGTSHEGLGIGLTLVRSIVQMHEGSVEVESPGVGKGSTFRMLLPASLEPAVIPQAKKKNLALASEKLQVVVVDDNESAAKILGMLLKSIGHEVHTAFDGEHAVQIATEVSPDIVFMDIGMPKMSGYQAARLIRQQPGGDQIRLVALTGWGQPEDRQQAEEAGFDHHLVKPPAPGQLSEILKLGRKSN